MSATDENTTELLKSAASAIEEAEQPERFDFVDHFMEQGCSEVRAIELTDFLTTACGRVLGREIGVSLPETYQRRLADGSWSEDRRFDADPTWAIVEAFVESLRAEPEPRERLDRITYHSALADGVRLLERAGSKAEELKGAKHSTFFYTHLDD